MKTIWKYTLDITGAQALNMPTDAEILSVQFQGESLCLWALVDTEAIKRNRHIEIFGTGHAVNGPRSGPIKFIATVQQPELSLVWHIFQSVI